MSLRTVTSVSLLIGLQDPENRTVWADYVDRYRPLIVGYCRRLGLEPADAEDVAQEALLAFATSYRDGRYDPERGRLRSWLFGIARTTLKNWTRRRPVKEVQVAATSGPDPLALVEDENRLETLWDAEWRDAVLRQCLKEVRAEVEPRTFRAFELFAKEGLPAREVAERVGISENAVFGAKRRILRRIRELHPAIEEIW